MTGIKEIKGWHVAAMFVGGFAIIISVNLALAYNAIATFPGLETKSSYVASQTFDANRAAQNALGWTVNADIDKGILELRITDANGPVRPRLEKAQLGWATSVHDDQSPEFTYVDGQFVAPVKVQKGNWNLRLKAIAEDGTIFQQRIVLYVHE